MNDKQYYLFKRTTTLPNINTSVEHLYICNEGESWPTIMRQFAAFLDGCGYVGVYEELDELLEENNR
tara:strand:+ start:3435 stop:3635 length:201 start_codon:yes stop_codon:yes gene_type:complete